MWFILVFCLFKRKRVFNYLTWIFKCLVTHFCWVAFFLIVKVFDHSFRKQTEEENTEKREREESKMSFTGTLDKCKACDKTVYFVDLLNVDGMTYHKSCFKCTHCKGTLVVCVFPSFNFFLILLSNIRMTSFIMIYNAYGPF